jgi:hypothetical protein
MAMRKLRLKLIVFTLLTGVVSQTTWARQPFLFTTIKALNIPGGPAVLSWSPNPNTANIYSAGAQTYTLSNTGGTAATSLGFNFPLVQTNNQFWITGKTCGTTLNAGSSCTVTVNFYQWTAIGLSTASLVATAGAVSATLTNVFWDDGNGI